MEQWLDEIADIVDLLMPEPPDRREHRWLMSSIDKTAVTYECTECGQRVTTHEAWYYRIDTLSFEACPGRPHGRT